MARRYGFALVGFLLTTQGAFATVYSAEATHNITVQTAGPRQGGNGLNFFNVEGNNNGTFSSFGVADFTVANLGIGGTVTDISRLTVKVVSANAAFSYWGVINVWLTSDTSTSTAQSGSPLRFDANYLQDGLGPQLDTKWQIGTFYYDVDLGSGYTFQVDATSLDPAAKAYIISQLNSGSLVRVVLSPNEFFAAGTFAGYSHNTYAGPTLEVDVTESSAAVSGVIGFTDRVGNFPATVNIEFKDPGDFSVVHTAMNVAVDGSGNYSTSDLPGTPGSYLVSVQPSPYLRRTVGPVNTGGNATANLTLVNGDVDGDNEVGIGDYSQLSAAYGSFNGDPTWNAAADLNGDDEVGISDYAILSSSYGAFGDD